MEQGSGSTREGARRTQVQGQSDRVTGTNAGGKQRGGGWSGVKGLQLARPAGAWRVSPVIRPRSRWAPQSRNQNANWPRASGCAWARPPWEGEGTSGSAEGIPAPAPTAGLAGCDSAIRGRPRPTPAPREQLPRKMNIPPLPRPGPLAQSRPVVPAAPQNRAGSLTPTRAPLPGGDAGGGGAPGR